MKQLHVAGHGEHGTHLFDDHRGPVPPSVWDLYRAVVSRFGDVPTLIEWDLNVPALAVVVAEAHKARALSRAAVEATHAA